MMDKLNRVSQTMLLTDKLSSRLKKKMMTDVSSRVIKKQEKDLI